MLKFTTGVSSSAFKVGTVIADDKKANISDRYTSEKPTYRPHPSKTTYNVPPTTEFKR